MVGTLDKFYIEQDARGARIMTHSHQLTPGCSTEAEIDAMVQLLKDDLDACARQMKMASKSRGALFARGPHG